jgi:CzcA family heavy metal efflux pump
MRWLVGTALELRVLVVALAALLLVLGIDAARNLSLDAFPEFAPPLVEIQTEAPGLSTEEVESLVTAPLESALNGIPRLATIRSKSVLGLSSVVLIFEDGTDLLLARQAVQERLATEAAHLPEVARAPIVLPPLSSTSRALKVGLSSASLSQMDLSTLALWTIRPRLLAIPGVANVAIWGQRARQLQIEFDPDRLAANGVTLDAVMRAAADATAVGGGGFVDTPNQRFSLRQIPIEDSPQALAAAIVELRGGNALRIGDVSDVRVGSPPPIGDAIVNDAPGLLLVVEKYPWGNTLEVTRRVEAALAALGPALAGVEVDSGIFRPAGFIERSIENLGEALLLGSLLVALVLLLFFYEWRAALVSVITIPLAVAIALVVLRAHGATLNTMLLAGLAIAVGVVVDDAVIDVENIARRLRLARSGGPPVSMLRVVLEASLEVRSAVVLASAIVTLVCVPVFFLPGVAGAFFRPLVTAYVVAVAASLLVALTVTPALSLLLLPRAPVRRQDPAFLQRLKASYRGLLPWFLDQPRRAAAVIGVSMLAALVMLPLLGEEFLPRFRERNFLMHWIEKPGTSLEALSRVTLRVSRELRAIPGVRSFGAHLGRAEQADEVVGPNFSELWIGLDESVDYDATLGRIEAVIAGYPGLQRDVLTYLRERIKEVLAGTGASIAVRIYGPDLEGLRRQARGVAGAIGNVPGVRDLKIEAQALVPQISVRLRPDAAALLGLSAAQVQRAVATQLQGAKVGEVRRDQKRFDVVVIGAERVRGDVEAVHSLPIGTPAGASVPLGDVADIELVAAQNEVKREGASRRIDVTCNVEGADLGSVAREIETRVNAFAFEPESHPEFLGEYAARSAARTRLILLSGAALAAIFLLLHADFGSLRLAGLVFLTLPFALVGSLAAALVAGATLSLGSLVGLVTVLGIAARNGIMLLSHYRHLEREEAMPFGRALLVRGAEERIAPILMTALCAGLALLPIVIGGRRPGQELEHPMAVVILGGLVSSTALNLLLMPALYGWLGRALAAPAGTGDGCVGRRDEP